MPRRSIVAVVITFLVHLAHEFGFGRILLVVYCSLIVRCTPLTGLDDRYCITLLAYSSIRSSRAAWRRRNSLRCRTRARLNMQTSPPCWAGWQLHRLRQDPGLATHCRFTRRLWRPSSCMQEGARPLASSVAPLALVFLQGCCRHVEFVYQCLHVWSVT